MRDETNRSIIPIGNVILFISYLTILQHVFTVLYGLPREYKLVRLD